MFGVGTGELLMLVFIALLVLGPERMPKLARDLGRVIRDLRKTSDELRDEFLHADEPPGEVIRFKTPKPRSGADITPPPLQLPPAPPPPAPATEETAVEAAARQDVPAPQEEARKEPEQETQREPREETKES